jgi:hypothetical protein
MVGSSSAIVSGLGKVLQTAGKFASTIGNAYKTVSNGIASFVSNIGKGMVNQVGSMLGKQTAVIGGAPTTVGEGFKAFMSGVADDAANIISPFRGAAQAVEVSTSKAYERNFGIDAVDEAMDFDIEQPFKQAAEDFRFYEVPKSSITSIVDSEKKGFTKLLSDVTSYATNTAKGLPNRAIDTMASMAVEGVGTKAMQAAGLSTVPEYNVQNVTNVTPQFNSAPIQSRYESSGVNYGATPQSRIEFFAANQPAYGDFGTSAFSNFASIRTV